MELSMSPMLLAVFGLVTALVVSLVNALRFKVDPREPPVIYPKIPLVGHMIGMLTEGMTYYKNLQSVLLPGAMLLLLTTLAAKHMDTPFSHCPC